jgi:hypothetical protein
MTFCADAGLFQSFGSSALAFRSARRFGAVSQSKMPPQQAQRFLDLVGDVLGLGAHGASSGNGKSIGANV